ncbi:MAG TPA: sugar phosphate nucleotidyltransferase [Methylomirabilota bacterium]|nr:sugar phosphate nucleotidyltransferase [Methylomirabilota bacterium]
MQELSTSASPAPGSSDRGQVWAVVLAGGQGIRLRELTRHVYGDDRPKQYAVLTGSKSLLRQTLDRVSRLVPRQQIAVVTMAGHSAYVTAELKHETPTPHVIEQPRDRGTAAAVLLAAHWILARDPAAMMVVLPSDHFVGEDEAFMGHVGDALGFLDRQGDRIVLLGAQPAEPETDYGWIELGEPLPGSGPSQLYRVRHFREKPTQAMAEELYRGGALWNTFVFAGRATTLVEAGSDCLPALHERLIRLSRFLGTEHERWAIRQAYELSPRANFSQAVLERCPRKLAVVRLSAVSWRDLGTPRRVVKTLGELGMQPDWLRTLQPSTVLAAR